MTYAALPIRRGCGSRKQGGIYGECGLSPWGSPLEAFLMDPPVPVDPPALGLHAIGVTVLDDRMSGATHLVDWVGERYYPNVTDLLEEVRVAGLSRRLPRTLDFGQLDDKSRILLVHRRALVQDPAPYLADWRRSCPKGLPPHREPARVTPHCAALWWQDVQGGEALTADGVVDARLVRRRMPGFQYVAHGPPAGVTARYAPAIFASFPISRLVVIADPEGQTHEAALARAGRAHLPLDLEEV